MAESNQSHAQDAQYASSGDADAVTADAWGCTLKTRQYITELQAVLEREICMRESAQRTLQLKKQQWEESFNDLRTHFERSSATQRDSLNLLIERERELKQRLNACNEQLAAVLSSTSWKLTAPLRVVARIFPAELRSKIGNIFRSRS